jgi:hypothetical protein
MSSDQGYILFQRGHRDHPLFQEPDKLGAWLWIMLSAAHTARVVITTNGERVPLEPGQLTFSIRFLANRWGWSENKLKRFLAAIARDQLVTVGTAAGATTGQTIITICNWLEIQRRTSQATTATTTARTTATNTATTTKKKQLKQLERDSALKTEPEGFQDWYSIYPKKKQPEAAKRAFTKVVGGNLIALPLLLERTRAFAAATNWVALSEHDRKFIPYPASWLNAGGYNDEPDAAANPAATLSPVNPADFTDAEWEEKLKVLLRFGQWSPTWGAQPGEQGCLVPSHLIVAPALEGSLRAEAAAPLRRETPADC